MLKTALVSVVAEELVVTVVLRDIELFAVAVSLLESVSVVCTFVVRLVVAIELATAVIEDVVAEVSIVVDVVGEDVTCGVVTSAVLFTELIED